MRMIVLSLLATLLRAQPTLVKPGAQAHLPPADAVVLFDGSSLEAWTKPDGSATGCTIDSGKSLLCVTGARDAVSREKHRSAQIHVEFLLPRMPEQKGQLRANSGVYLMGCYELQVLDSLDNPTYADGIAGALYGFAAPMVNASRAAGEWQSYDVLFSAPACNAAGEVEKPASATVLHNGVLVQWNTVMAKKGGGCQQENLCQAGPLRLQDHSGFPQAPRTEMRFRNIWLRHLR
jgi:hypothetical protein